MSGMWKDAWRAFRRNFFPAQRFAETAARYGVVERHLWPKATLTGVNFQFTGQCNLRCVYCPQGTDLNDHTTDSEPLLINEVVRYVRKNDISSCHLGFYGETLSFKGWERYGQQFLNSGATISMTSNLSRRLNDDEVDVLSQMGLVFVSIDTADLELLKKIRTADGRTIIYNVHLIRSRAIADGRKPPEIACACTLSANIVFHLKDLVGFALSFGASYLFLNDLYYFEGLDHDVKSLFDLTGEEFLIAAEALDAALELATQNGIGTHKPWEERMARKKADEAAGRKPADDDYARLPMKNIQGDAYYFSTPVPKGKTRMCLEPWETVFVMPKGEVYTCCSRGVEMGRVTPDNGIDDVLSNEAYTDLRGQFLSGNITDETCKHCQLRPVAEVAELQAAVSALITPSDPAPDEGQKA